MSAVPVPDPAELYADAAERAADAPLDPQTVHRVLRLLRRQRADRARRTRDGDAAT